VQTVRFHTFFGLDVIACAMVDRSAATNAQYPQTADNSFILNEVLEQGTRLRHRAIEAADCLSEMMVIFSNALCEKLSCHCLFNATVLIAMGE